MCNHLLVWWLSPSGPLKTAWHELSLSLGLQRSTPKSPSRGILFPLFSSVCILNLQLAGELTGSSLVFPWLFLSCSAWDFWEGPDADTKSILEFLTVRLCFGWVCILLGAPVGFLWWHLGDCSRPGLCLSVYPTEDLSSSVIPTKVVTHHPWSWNPVLWRLIWSSSSLPQTSHILLLTDLSLLLPTDLTLPEQTGQGVQLGSFICVPDSPFGLWQGEEWALSFFVRVTGLLGWVSFCSKSCSNPGADIFRVFGNGSGTLSGYTGRPCHASRLPPTLSHTIPSCLGCQAVHIAGIFF